MVDYVNGLALSPALQAECKRRYVHRFTREHVPTWARQLEQQGRPCPVQFASDAEWLANTSFPVTARGKLANRPGACRSNPTWPDGRQTA